MTFLTARGAPALLNAPGAPPPGAAARLAALARRSSGLSLARAAALEDSPLDFARASRRRALRARARVDSADPGDRRDDQRRRVRSAHRHDRPPERTAHGGRSRRPADHRRHAVQRPALLHPQESAAAGPRRAAAGRQRGIDSRRRRPARAGALRRAHGLQRHAPLPEAGCRRLPAVDGHALRRAHQRQHELRSDGLPAADSHRQCRRHRPVAAHPGRLGACRLVRSRGDRQGARRHPRGVAGGPRRRRADARRAASRPAQGLPLRRSPADRQARDHPDVPLRPSEEVLHRLVPARSDGGHRRRRFRSVGDRSAHQVALRRHPGAPRRRGRGRSTTCPISRARDIPSPPTPRPPPRRSASPA